MTGVEDELRDALERLESRFPDQQPNERELTTQQKILLRSIGEDPDDYSAGSERKQSRPLSAPGEAITGKLTEDQRSLLDKMLGCEES